MKKTLAIVLALVMILSLATTAFAATGTITITPPDGVAADEQITYTIYKVFDAVGDGTNISYKLVSGKDTAPTGFAVDAEGNVSYVGTTDNKNLTDDVIAAIGAYVTDADKVATVTTTGTTPASTGELPNGYYYITTTTGTVVIIDSTNPNASVKDKNTVPTLDKKITGAASIDAEGQNAIAQVGTSVNYQVTITVGKGAVDYVFHDRMTTGLTYNDDVAVKVGGVDVDSANYDKTTAAGDTFTISFADAYIAGLAVGTEIVITYSATINEDALTVNTADNTAWLDYGEDNSTTSDTVKVYNADISVDKVDGNGAPLSGAGFVLKNSADKYYKWDDENGVVTWVDSINDADVHTSDSNGDVEAFDGLSNGTYYLVEKVVPAGYNKASDTTVTIADADFTASNLSQTKTIENNSGTELPSTGGIGTTLFYIFGGILVVGAVVLLVTKKRMSVN